MTNFLVQIFVKDSYCYSALVDQIVISPALLFYTHIPTIIIALIVGLFIFYRNPKNFAAKIFLLLTVFFFLFTLGDLVEWFAFLGRGVVMFARTIIQLIDPILFLLSFYFLYILINRRDISFFYKILWLLPLTPVVIAILLGQNLVGYDWASCEAVENHLLTNYGFYLDIFYLISIIVFAVWSIVKEKTNRKEVSIASLGVGSFVLLFFVMEYVFTGYVFGNPFDYSYFVYAFFGMPILIIFLAYLIIRFKMFKTQLISAQIFVFGIFSFIFAQYFFLNNLTAVILNTVSLVFALGISSILIKNVKQEIKQKEELETLNADLKILIKQRESLTHLINHKVKSSFTHSKYIFAGLLDGTFGEINEEVKRRAEQGFESNEAGIKTIDLILNTANIQKGLVKYDMKRIDFRDVVLKALSEKKVPAENKGLKIERDIKEDDYFILGDVFWMKETVSNLIENSIDYTKSGKITAMLEKKDGKILFLVRDTGIGITEEDKKNLFTEGGRGRESNKINVDSTGYGLYSVKLVVEAHGGRVWAESEGADKGSTFFIELPEVK